MLEAVLESRVERDVVAERNELRGRVEATLESLSRELGPVLAGENGRPSRVRDAVAFLGQVLAAWPQVPDDAFPAEGAGFAASVVVADLDTAARDEYTLLNGPLLDFDAGHVSLASPIGQALLGARPGDTVVTQLPQRLRRLRVSAVQTLADKLEDYARLRVA